MKVILLGHRKYVGKDTIADILCDHAEMVFGPTKGLKLGFADAIKDEAYRLFNIYGLKHGWWYDRPGNTYLKDVRIPSLNQTPREIWISLGTWGRSINERLWSDLTAQMAKQAMTAGRLVAVKDLRYPTEPQSFIDLKIPTLLVRVLSDRAGGLDGPDSALLDYEHWDYTFFNNVPRDQLKDKVLEEIWPRLELETP